MATVQFFNQNVTYRFGNRKAIKLWLQNVIHAEQKKAGPVTIILCDDAYLLELNMKYLAHETLTDVITFDYSEGILISGDVFISIDRIKENASLFSKTVNNELMRVMVHGVLHLCGYKDKTKKDSALMREKEDTYLAMLAG